MSLTRKTSQNQFKKRLLNGERQIGIWSVLADSYVAELLAGCGYDWILIDAEHGPNDLRTVLAQLQGISAALVLQCERDPRFSNPIVRLPYGDTVLIKQYLEIGVETILIPMVETARQAQLLVDAVRYPPHGVRGMGSGLGRSSRWGRFTDYVSTSADNTCLLVQIESREGLRNLEAIASVDGIDGVLIGPADLAADMGFPQQVGKPEVVQAIRSALEKLKNQNMPTGIMHTDPEAALGWLNEGMTFAGVGVDSSLLIKGADALLSRFREGSPPSVISAY